MLILAISNLTGTKQTVTMSKIALETNVLMYLYDSFEEKKIISEALVATTPFISSQVIFEFLNVTKRLQKLPKYEV